MTVKCHVYVMQKLVSYEGHFSTHVTIYNKIEIKWQPTVCYTSWLIFNVGSFGPVKTHTNQRGTIEYKNKIQEESVDIFAVVHCGVHCLWFAINLE